MTTLGDIMTKDLITVSPDTLGDEIAKIFETNSFHHLPVVDKDGKLNGIISKSDYLLLCNHLTQFKADKQEVENDRFFRSLIASDFMTKKVVTLEEGFDVKVAAAVFGENRFHALPIVSDDGNLVGIVTTFDLINYAFEQPVSS